MIRYALICAHRHTFDAWFRNSDTFDTQVQAGDIACPECGNQEIAKAIMAPRVAKSGGKSVEGHTDAGPALPDGPEPAKTLAVPEPATPIAPEMMTALRTLRRIIEQTGESVGRNFAEEARKIHYGETPPRAIYGDATADEAEALADEGIEIARIPWVPLGH